MCSGKCCLDFCSQASEFVRCLSPSAASHYTDPKYTEVGEALEDLLASGGERSIKLVGGFKHCRRYSVHFCGGLDGMTALHFLLNQSASHARMIRGLGLTFKFAGLH